jgi:hypothetical protein
MHFSGQRQLRIGHLAQPTRPRRRSAHPGVDIDQFVGLAKQASGHRLGPFFHRWRYERGKP